MEEDQIRIKKMIALIGNQNSYSIDIDDSITFYEFKKILSGAAHLLKNSFRIYHKGKEYTNEYNENTIKEIFSQLNPIHLEVISKEVEVNEIEDEIISVNFNINIPCETHIEKYKMFYCFTCNKSICTDCLTQGHSNHNIVEKAEYLAPAKLLMDNIFSNSSLYKADSRLSKYSDCSSFRLNLKINIFDNLRKLINELEFKFDSCLDFFSRWESVTEKNTNENLELLKEFCIESYIKLKNDINTKGIIIDDKIFLALYNKLKEIENYKNGFFEENKKKFETLNSLLEPFIQQIKTISKELKLSLDTYLEKEIYENFKNLIQENMVELIQKEEVDDLMFRNLGVSRKSLNRKEFRTITSFKKCARPIISKDKVFKKQNQEKNFFKKTSLSIQIPENRVNNEGDDNLNGKKYEKLNDENEIFKELSSISEKNDIKIIENNDENKYYSRIKSSLINNIYNSNNKDNFKINASPTIENNINNNLNSDKIINNFNNDINIPNIQNEINPFNISEKFNSDKITKYSIQQENNIQKKDELSNSIQVKIQEKTLNTDISQTIPTFSKNIFDKDLNMNYYSSLNNNLTNNYSQVNDNYINNHQKYNYNLIENPKTSCSKFDANLIEILNSEIIKKENKNKDSNNSIINVNNNEVNNEIRKEIIKNEENKSFEEYNNEDNSFFLFMAPIFNTNEIIGVFEDETTGQIEIDFDQIFGDNEFIYLNEFTQGGAFCNFKNNLFITGGQEKQIGIGKLFLKLIISKRNYQIKLFKMPFMNYCHWNHSMIGKDKYIFVIGGYNSNKCEYFNLVSLKWEFMPNLNIEENQRPILAFNNDYLYTFMGHTQYDILDMIERINISQLGNSKWEVVQFYNPNSINIKFFGAGVFYYNEELLFIGGKEGLGNEDKDYKNKIDSFNFNNMEFTETNISFSGKLNFIENQIYIINECIFGNFIESYKGCLASFNASSFFE